MNKGLIGALCFIGGLGIGGVGGYFIAKEKYFSTLDADREEMRKSFEEAAKKAKKAADTVKTEIKEETETVKEVAAEAASKIDLKEIAKDYKGYFTSTHKETPKETVKPKEEPKVDVDKSIRVIPPSSFGENEEYERITLTYTANDYILDEDGEPIDDTFAILDMSESEVYDHFGEYEEDSVFVVNNDRETYYEILMTEEEYEE